MNNFTIKYKATFTGTVSIDASSYEDALEQLKDIELHNLISQLSNCDEWDLEVEDE